MRTEQPAGATGTPLDLTFTATLVRSPAPGGWTYVVWPEPVARLGTRGGSGSGAPSTGVAFTSSALLRRGTGKQEGDEVVVHLEERLT